MLEITEPLLITLAGEAAYKRGLEYFRQQRIENLMVNGNSIRATAIGSHDYSVRLKLTNTMLDGSCDCPASEGMDFCKHCVATALEFKKQFADAKTGGDDEQIQAFFRTLDQQQLITELMNIIKNDTRYKDAYLLKAQYKNKTLDAKSLKKRITKALPYRSLWGREVNFYFAQAQEALEPIFEIAGNLPAEEAFKLAEYALQRLNKALEKMDDSYGARFDLQASIIELYETSFKKLPWSKNKKAKFLLKHLMLSTDISAEMDGLIDSPELEKVFLDLVKTRWDELPKLSDGADWQEKYKYRCLSYPLILAAQQNDDINTEISIRDKLATEVYDFIQLGELSLENSLLDLARHYLDRSQKLLDPKDEEKVWSFQYELLLAQKNWQAAYDLNWKMYQKRKHLDLLDARLELGQKLNVKREQLLDEVEHYLVESLIQEKSSLYYHPSYNLIDFYIHTNQQDKAIDIAKQYPVLEEQLKALALYNLPINSHISFEFYRRIVDPLAALTNNGSYREAVKHLKDLQLEMLKLKMDMAEFSEFIEAFKTRYKRKANLIKYIREELDI